MNRSLIEIQSGDQKGSLTPWKDRRAPVERMKDPLRKDPANAVTQTLLPRALPHCMTASGSDDNY